MLVEISIIKSPENVNNSETSHTFSESGGSLGRGPNNNWVLDDPDKYMSSVHSRIIFENGEFLLVDMSTNGTFVNGSPEPVGRGIKITLAEGDRFIISDYEFIVNFQGGAAMNNDLFSQSGSGNAIPESSDRGDSMFTIDGAFSAPAGHYVPISDEMSGFDIAETDPLVALDRASGQGNQSSAQNDLFPSHGNSMEGGGIALNDAVDWPSSNIEAGVIPDDWDASELVMSAEASLPPSVTPLEDAGAQLADSHAPNREMLTKLESDNKKLIDEVAQLKQQIKAQEVSSQRNVPRVATAADEVLMESLGFSGKSLNQDKALEMSETIGLLVRETMEGMMQVLSFRKKIKEEFRINVTTIQPVENNPLKFSANIDDAMENMFFKNNKAYKEPVDAVREGFQGIAEHQVAVLAGMQAAFRGMLERLDPEALEKRFEKYKKPGLIHLGKNRKNWESYKAYHAELADNPDDSFQYLFGYDFVQAYEEQMQRLAVARKTNSDRE